MMIEHESAMNPTPYPILLLLFEFPLSSLQRGQIQECKLPVQRLVIPAGVVSSRCSCLSAEKATYDCFSSSYLSISGIKGCEIDGGMLGVLLVAGRAVSYVRCLHNRRIVYALTRVDSEISHSFLEDDWNSLHLVFLVMSSLIRFAEFQNKFGSEWTALSTWRLRGWSSRHAVDDQNQFQATMLGLQCGSIDWAF